LLQLCRNFPHFPVHSGKTCIYAGFSSTSKAICSHSVKITALLQEFGFGSEFLDQKAAETQVFELVFEEMVRREGHLLCMSG
jgi:hypothetical protein